LIHILNSAGQITTYATAQYLSFRFHHDDHHPSHNFPSPILACGAPTPIPPVTFEPRIILKSSTAILPSQNLEVNGKLDLPFVSPAKAVLSRNFVDTARSSLGTSALGSQALVPRTSENDDQNTATAERYFQALYLWRQKHWPSRSGMVNTVDSIRDEYSKNGRINYVDIILDKVALQSNTEIQDTFHSEGSFVLSNMERDQYNRKVAFKFFSFDLETKRLEARAKGQSYYGTVEDIKKLYTARNGHILYHNIQSEASRIHFPYTFDLNAEGRAATHARVLRNVYAVRAFCSALRRWYKENAPTNEMATMTDSKIKAKFRVSEGGGDKKLDYRKMENEVREKNLKDKNGSLLKFNIT
ncbi:hypothetical protein H0H93_009618, partial [Arthromyces matolae]